MFVNPLIEAFGTKAEALLAASPFVIRYDTEIVEPSSNALPKTPSPNDIWNSPSFPSCKKYTVDSDVISKISVTAVYTWVNVFPEFGVTDTLIVVVSIPSSGKVNVDFGFEFLL